MRIVIKVGTNVLTNNSYKIELARLEHIINQIHSLHQKGHEVILVSSGAVGSGHERMPNISGMHAKQVWAAVGQPLLMHWYTKYGDAVTMPIGQCLLLRGDFTDRERYDNFIGTVEGLLEAHALPIINENDVVSLADLTVGDNDLLASMVAVAVQADMLVLLTNQKGLFTANPDTDPSATFIPTIDNVDFELEKLCSKETSSLGRGGMLSKVRAAKHAVHAGTTVYIADGGQENILEQLLVNDSIATKFIAKNTKPLSNQQRWIMASKGVGQLIIDDGAATALQNNKSLLMPGIVALKGMFEKDEIVEVLDGHGKVLAYGKAGYSSTDIQASLRSKKTPGTATKMEKEIIHRDHMVTLNN